MTVPTISQIKGNTLLELFKNGYNTLKNAITGKQNKLIAGDNIVIDESTNTISAIEGGSLADYYTKEETDALLNDKADSDDVYDKTETYSNTEVYSKAETDTLVANAGYKEVTITPTIVGENNQPQYVNVEGLQNGDIVEFNFTSTQSYSIGNLSSCVTSGVFIFNSNNTSNIGSSISMGTFTSGGSATVRAIVGTHIEQTYADDVLKLDIKGSMFYIYGSPGSYGIGDTTTYLITINKFTVLRRA